ncbi:cytochrome aa3 quinol oxidase subunit II [Shouchella sp. JSM 1781072]|uniref:cytochrome aa3 quinol oxidase subunit II n=1 Tax=Bacillaceae TaxID=186817 RepID=UPI000C08226E|nr:MULTISPECIES: cytochrome aa3 quinol oxidase subunit II [Bacillaceae]UTR04645.1 cytochrome aa3 quinol oxidase subunit II [Alkalihalobacillus sp. LMS6]
MPSSFFKWISLAMVAVFLSGCGSLTVLDPQGPVAEQQSDLIWLSIWFMIFIVLVVFVLLTIMLVKYRDRGNNDNYDPTIEGSHKLEFIWTIIPIVIVTILSIPTVMTIYSLEEAPEIEEVDAQQEPLVIHATSANWKWIFSYPEQGIETVNYINIPEDRPILFKLTSADAMASFWVPQLGGQKYAMSGMETELYLAATEVGQYEGRNANFTGEGFAEQRFTVTAQTDEAFDEWVEETQENAPSLSEEEYMHLMVPGHSEEMTFSSTHLEFVNHAYDATYSLEKRAELGYEAHSPHSREGKAFDLPLLTQPIDTDKTYEVELDDE